jgi:hypothetical protein
MDIKSGTVQLSGIQTGKDQDNPGFRDQGKGQIQPIEVLGAGAVQVKGLLDRCHTVLFR